MRQTRYQFSLRGKTVAAPLIDRKILICLTRVLAVDAFRAEAKEEDEGATRACHAVVQQERQRAGDRAADGGRREGKKKYIVSLPRCQKRDAYLLIGTLCSA